MKNIFKVNGKIMIGIVKAFLLTGLLWLNFSQAQNSEKQNAKSIYRAQNHAVINQTHQTLPNPETGMFSKKQHSVQSTVHNKPVNFLKTKRLTRPLSNRLTFAHYRVKKRHHTKMGYHFSKHYTVTPLRTHHLSSLQAGNGGANRMNLKQKLSTAVNPDVNDGEVNAKTDSNPLSVTRKQVAVKLSFGTLVRKGVNVDWEVSGENPRGVTISPLTSQTDTNGVATTVVQNTAGGNVIIIASAPDKGKQSYTVPYPDRYVFADDYLPITDHVVGADAQQVISTTVQKNNLAVPGIPITWTTALNQASVNRGDKTDQWIADISYTNEHGVAKTHVSKATKGKLIITATAPDKVAIQNGSIDFQGYDFLTDYFIDTKTNPTAMQTSDNNKTFTVKVMQYDISSSSWGPALNVSVQWTAKKQDGTSVTNAFTDTQPTNTEGVSTTTAAHIRTTGDYFVTATVIKNSQPVITMSFPVHVT